MAGDRSASRWPVQDAKAHFSELLEASLDEGPQILTREGVEIAVLVAFEEWRQLQSSSRPALKKLLLAEFPRAEIPVPPRQGPECHTSEDTAQRGWRAVFGTARREDVEAVDAISAELDRIEDEQK